MSELLPCPFCGHDPILDFSNLPNRPLAKKYYVHCVSEDCRVSPSTMRFRQEEIAIAAWNTREREP
jgi:hypothetical protein